MNNEETFEHPHLPLALHRTWSHYLLGQHGKLLGELADALETDHDERHVRHDEPVVGRRRDLVHQLRQQSVGAWGDKNADAF